MTKKEICIKHRISDGADSLLYSELATRPPKKRARRLAQLAYLGLLHEKQMLAGVTAPASQPASPTQPHERVSNADPSSQPLPSFGRWIRTVKKLVSRNGGGNTK